MAKTKICTENLAEQKYMVENHQKSHHKSPTRIPQNLIIQNQPKSPTRTPILNNQNPRPKSPSFPQPQARTSNKNVIFNIKMLALA